MNHEQGPRKGKTNRLFGFLPLIAAVFGGIGLIVHPTLLDVVIEIVLLANVGVHWKDLLGRRDRDQREPS